MIGECRTCSKRLRSDNKSGFCSRHYHNSLTGISWHQESYRRRKAERQSWLWEIKKAKGCADCGYNLNPVALDFDHIPDRGKKLFQVGNIYLWSKEKLLAEIAKCEVVCANCHRIRTYERQRHNAGQV